MRAHSEIGEDRFVRLFGEVKGTAFTARLLQALGTAMTDGSAGARHSKIPAGYTYLGQFIVHDITQLGRGAVRPTGAVSRIDDLLQVRTSAFDLDSVYGSGFDDEEIAIDQETGAFRLGTTFKNGLDTRLRNDLPRKDDGTALIPDTRNDENLLLSQLHVQFLKLHNHFLTKAEETHSPRERFDAARDLLLENYQRIVVEDFLFQVLDKRVWEYVFLDSQSERLWSPLEIEAGQTPVELTAAALRFGHSMVQSSYNITAETKVNLTDMFYWTGFRGLKKERGLPESLVVDWSRFFDYPDAPPSILRARPILPWLTLFRNQADTNIAARLAIDNLLRGNELGLPAGQDLVDHIWKKHPSVAKKISLEVVPPGEFDRGPAPDKPKFSDRLKELGLNRMEMKQLAEKTPLFGYLMMEAFVVNEGRRLGPLGSLIVAESFRGLMAATPGALERIAAKCETNTKSDHLTMGHLLALLKEKENGESV